MLPWVRGAGAKDKKHLLLFCEVYRCADAVLLCCVSVGSFVKMSVSAQVGFKQS